MPTLPASSCFRLTRIMRYASSESAPSRVPHAVYSNGQQDAEDYPLRGGWEHCHEACGENKF